MLRHSVGLVRIVVPTTGFAIAKCDKASLPPTEYEESSNILSSKILMHKITNLSTDFGIPSANIPNPACAGAKAEKIIEHDDCILHDIVRKGKSKSEMTAFHRAGPRSEIHFEPSEVRAAIVTCGGLCPGLNNIVRNIVDYLSDAYGVDKVYGIRGGYHGFHLTGESEASDVCHDKNTKHVKGSKPCSVSPMIKLTPELVADWHRHGGTNLGTSRGGFDAEKIIEFIEKHKINQLYVIGGDGTHRGAFNLVQALDKRNLNVAVCGVPKTIDNDIGVIDYSFGFHSAVQAAQLAISSAVVEAKGNMPNGVGVVKLMGRSSGYIAAHATIANGSVDLCLIPEVPTIIDPKDTRNCLKHIEDVVSSNGHAVVVVAEGAGEDLLGGASTETDAGGNKKLLPVGEFLVGEITKHFKSKGKQATVKYIDPSYTVRSVPAAADDSIYCQILAAGAVHGAMAGFTGFSVGMVNNHSVLIPIQTLVENSPRMIDKHGRTWDRVLRVTGQPNTVTRHPDEDLKQKKKMHQ